MPDISRETLLAELRERLSRRQTLAAAIGLAALALAGDADAKKKKRKKKKSKKKDKGKDPAKGNENSTGCPAGQIVCDDACRDISTDREHCGECYESCYDGQICSAGRCTVPCSEHACLKGAFEDDFGGYRLALMPDGNIAALGGDNQVGVYSPTGQLLRTFGEFGTEVGEFRDPYDIAAGPDGKLYVSDQGNKRIQVIDANGVFTVVPYQDPYHIAVTPSGRLFSTGYSSISRILDSGSIDYSWGADGTSGSQFSYWPELAVGHDGDIYALTYNDGKAYRFNDDGSGNVTLKWAVGGIGVDPGEFRNPKEVAVAGDRVYVADTGAGVVHVLNASDGSFRFKFPVTDTEGYALYFSDMVADTQGNLFIASDDIYVFTLKS